MKNNYIKYRSISQILVTFIFIFITYFSISSIADSVEKNVIQESSNNVVEEIISVNIPQGSSASQIASILDSTGVISFSTCV